MKLCFAYHLQILFFPISREIYKNRMHIYILEDFAIVDKICLLICERIKA